MNGLVVAFLIMCIVVFARACERADMNAFTALIGLPVLLFFPLCLIFGK